MASDPDTNSLARNVGVVVIGRNEGDRLIQCLASIDPSVACVVYVDSGSTDGSRDAARRAGAEVVELDLSRPFTAARARNAGVAAMRDAPRFIQFVDGDCELVPDWIDTAAGFLHTTPDAAAVCGRLREKHPEKSVYNRLCDAEWNTEVGQTKACGGIAMMRTTAFRKAAGFNENLIAGEEPELCLRLRQADWQIWRIDAEMGWHDANMLHFGQWWTRARRGGHAAAEAAAMHGQPPERHGFRQTFSALAWGAILPMVIFLGYLVTPWALALSLLWPAQILRLSQRGDSWTTALFLVLIKFPEAQGVSGYWWNRLTARRAGLIEYK